MYRILIVDNEPYIVDWIASLIEIKCERELDICRAYTAKEAISWMEKTRVDVLVSDIRMPGTDGLVLAGIVKKRWPFSKVVIVTAYAEMDYALTAIQNNVAGFVLKNQGDEAILKAIEDAIDQVEKELENEIQRSEFSIEGALTELQNQLLNELLLDEVDFFHTISDLNRLGISMKKEEKIHFLMCEIKNMDWGTHVLERYQSKQRLVGHVEHVLGDIYRLLPILMYGNRIAWILIRREDIEEPYQENVLIQGRIEALQSMETAKCVFVLYPTEILPTELKRCYQIMNQQITCLKQEQDLFYISDTAEFYEELMDVDAVIKQLKELLLDNRKDLFLEYVQKYAEKIKEGKVKEKDIYALYYSIATMFYSYMNQLEFVVGQSLTSIREKLFNPLENNLWSMKFTELIFLINETFKKEEEIQKHITHNTVDRLKQYILEHTNEDISLTKLSFVTGYNTNYLSRVFSSQTGITLSEYIGRERMKLVSELMRNPNLNIQDISDRAGFQTRTYFNRFIKKWTGMSPKDYRSKLMQEGQQE